ncbi:MAG: hypothetical protein ABF617_08345 [Gluconobacter japonicus]|uniref:hypothetical protein n=1 Tax=Gluconobacter japonicus TaxID=376620 RepID=UPI0039ED73EC
MRLIPLAALSLLALSGCTFPHYANKDIACVRQNMTYGGPNHGSMPFDYAMGSCVQHTSDDALGIVNARQVPLDLRADPELQKLAENPETNPYGYAYVKR